MWNDFNIYLVTFDTAVLDLWRTGRIDAANALRYADTPHEVHMRIDFEKHEAYRGGRALGLTPREYALLELFLRRPEITLTRTVIGQRAFGLNFSPGTNVVDVYVSYLRKQLHQDGEPLIHTVRGVGYVLAREKPAS